MANVKIEDYLRNKPRGITLSDCFIDRLAQVTGEDSLVRGIRQLLMERCKEMNIDFKTGGELRSEKVGN